MNNKIRMIAISFCLLGIQTSFGQSGSLPPVSFPGGTNVCDPTSYKLVFYDGFDGTSVNSANWNTFKSWEGMQRTIGGTTIYGDHDDWEEARIDPTNAHVIFRDENVVVSGGTCKLIVKNENHTWQCPSCPAPVTENVTSGIIATPFKTVPFGGDNWYNTARIEARIKHAVFPGYWGTLWTWHGNYINELDITEATGPVGSLSWPYILTTRPKNAINMHAWAPRPNPLELPNPMSWGDVYPNQSWWDWVIGTNHKQNEFHVYACEWDTASIKIFLDHELVSTLWKYYKKQYVMYKLGTSYIIYTVKVPSGCSPSAGTWYITEGFPYNSNSHSHFRISNSLAKGLEGDSDATFTYGQTEVDYVKIWQRHPEGDHEEICNEPPITITGPSTMCGTTTYSTSPVTSGGTWSASNSAVTFMGGPAGGSSKLVKPNPASPYTSTVLSYTYTPPGCPPVTVSKTITNTGTIAANVFVSRNWYLLKEDFSLWVTPYTPGTTYSWKVWYGHSSSSLTYYAATGPYITTPRMAHYFLFPYYIKWELTMTNACGSKTISGVKDNMSYLSPIMASASTFMTQDSSTFYFETRFGEGDSLAYEQKVTARVENAFINDINDSVSIANKIGRIRMEELEPYLYFSDVNQDNPAAERRAIPETKTPDKTVLYPNPVHESIYVQFSERFNIKARIEYSIYNKLGQLLMNSSMQTPDEPINIKGFNKDVYFIKFQQGSIMENCSFVKE